MKYLILGAGPAGLSLANALLQRGEDDFVVLEREATAGGLCRSVDVDGSPLDIGGGHFLDVKRSTVNEFLFDFMPKDEWNYFERDSRIAIHDTYISHPFEANIWQMNIDDQVEYLKSIAIAGCNTGKSMPTEFVDWISWKLGDKIASDYMIPYNKKMFGDQLNELGTYWLNKLPNVSFEDTLRSCLMHKAFGSQPGHAHFFYPKRYGYGELWTRMARKLQDKIEYNKQVSYINFSRHLIVTQDGMKYNADKIITTIPWMEYQKIEGMPETLVSSIKKLKYSSVEIEYKNDNLNTNAQWIYEPNPNISYHRILVRKNFCPKSRGYWTETNSNRVIQGDSDNTFRYINKYAYPLNTLNKPMIMNELLDWSKEHLVYGLGRWGEHQHYNSDLVVELAIKLADEIA